MSRFKLICATLLICIAPTFCAIFEEHKKDGGLRSIDGCIPGHIMVAHFIDGSGTTTDAIDQAMTILNPDPNELAYCNGYRFIIAGVSYEYVPWPKNVTTWRNGFDAGVWLPLALKPYRGIFNLQDSVNTFFQLPQYSSYDPNSEYPPWAVIYAYSNTVNGINNLLNGISRLTSEGYMVLLISNQLTRQDMPQLLHVLPQSNIMSTCYGINFASLWLLCRYSMGSTVPTVNQADTSGHITSPNYPLKYKGGDIREYYITVPSPYNTILLTIHDFALTDCYDALFVYQGSMMDDDNYLYEWCGNMKAQNFTIQSNAVTLRFITRSTDRGFYISWTAIFNPPEKKSNNFIG